MSGLTPEQLAKRRYSLGSSDVSKVLEGGEAAYNLWLEKIGEKEHADLSDSLPVQIGIATEEVNFRWFKQQTGRHCWSRNLEVFDADEPWRTATLDWCAMIGDAKSVVDAKHVGGFEKWEVTCARYIPQLTHQALIMGYERMSLSVLIGNSRWAKEDFELDQFFAAELLEREREFWDCVTNNRPPGDWRPVIAPCKPFEFKPYDMQQSNAWARHASVWDACETIAKLFDTAAKELKALVPADASVAYGHGITVKRNGRGALTISRTKE